MSGETSYYEWLTLMQRRPQAFAIIKGSDQYPDVFGDVRFFQVESGVLVMATVSGLPNPEGNCMQPIFAFHIHGGDRCSGNETDPFADAGTHYNPGNCPHPHHAGDLPPLFGVNGNAFQVFLTDRFSVEEIIGMTVIIHSDPDDFTTQPSGNAGTKIACGVIRRRLAR